jgi:O-antigen/teichoic acid export membrane protein
VTSLIDAPRQILRRRFAREVLILQVGSLATFGVQFLASVVVPNVLGVDGYGTFALASNLLAVVTTFANLAVGQALVTRLTAAAVHKDRQESSNLLAYFLKLSLLVGLIQAAFGFLCVSWLGALLRYDPVVGDLARVLFLVPMFSVVLNLVMLALQSTRQAARLTLLESGTLILTSILNTTVVVLGGGVRGLTYTVAFAPLLASVAAALLYSATLPRMAAFPTLSELFRAAPRAPVRRYFAFSALVSVDKNFASLIALAPTTLLGMLSTATEVGYFSLGFKIMNFLSVPISPISRNLYAVLTQVALKGGPAGVGRTLLRATLFGGAVSVAGTAAMLLASPFILKIFRPEYAPVQFVIYALGLRFALLGFGVGLGPIYQVLNAMKLGIATKVLPALVMLGGGWVMIGQYGAVGAAATMVAAYLVGDLVNALLLPWLLRRGSQTGEAQDACRAESNVS